jgi:hypothetical protein
MPKNTVTDPITDQEIAFARLILSGTMNDRRAAEAVGLNPDTAAYTKSKLRVRAYMIEHRAAVREKLVDQEAEGLRNLNFGRDQILTRLWELATLSHEATRGTIAGQIKALSMIVAIEGLIPSGMNARRHSPSATQPTAPPIGADIDSQPVDEERGDAVAPAAPQVPDPEPVPEPAPKPAPTPSSLNLDRNQPTVANPFINPVMLNRVPDASDYVFDTVLHNANSARLSFSPDKRFSGRRR